MIGKSKTVNGLRGWRVRVKNACRPYGDSRMVFHFTRRFRARLSHPAATRLEFWWCLLHRLRSMVVLTQSRKPVSFCAPGWHGCSRAPPKTFFVKRTAVHYPKSLS